MNMGNLAQEVLSDEGFRVSVAYDGNIAADKAE